MWGIIPAAGHGTRIQPLAFSKELLPVGSRRDESGAERPRAVSEYLLERMARAGVDKFCFVISPGKADILNYYGGSMGDAPIVYAVQPRALGLCDAIFRASLFTGDDPVVIGLPDTVWFPSDALRTLPDDQLSFLLFPVDRPHLFDSVVTDESGAISAIDVKSRSPRTHWIWGALKAPSHALRSLRELWEERERKDEYLGTLVTAWLGRGNKAVGVRAGEAYVDVGTLDGYREALRVLAQVQTHGAETSPSFSVRG